MSAQHYAVVGPPGTGKTTYLKRQIELAARQLGNTEVAAVSLTRAAALELRGRVESIPSNRVGTLHSMSWRALDHPTIAETKVQEFNEAFPKHAISVKLDSQSLEHDGEARTEKTDGDAHYEAMNLARQRRRPVPPAARGWADAWQRWLDQTGYVDFTGLIEQAVEHTETAPGAPLAFFADEAQDLSRLEADLVMKWGRAASTFVTVGDPAQALYKWRGADPEAFFEAGERRVLSQSWRVPREVHRQATRWARKVLRDIRYDPKDERGRVVQDDYPLKFIADSLQRALAKNEGTVMLQAQCAYMLTPVIAELRDRGVPFWNPNRLSNGAWNPLGVAKQGSVRTVDRLRAFLECHSDWPTVERVRLFAPLLKAEVFVRGAKSRLDKLTTEIEAHDIWADDDTRARAYGGDTDWLLAHAMSVHKDRLAFLIRLAKRHDISADPRLMVGTIHSFKGSEADHVFLSPDLSPKGLEAWAAGGAEAEADIRRLFYVGMTRARHSLTLMLPSGRRAVAW